MKRNHRQIRFVRTSGVSAILVLIALTASAFGFASYLHTAVSDLEHRDIELFSEAWNVRYLDEALTHSAAQYVLTKGDRSWRTRYNELVTELDTTLEVLRSKSDPGALAPLDSVSSANDALVAIESKVFESADRGEFAQAQNLLGAPYERQKIIYRNGLDDFFNSQRALIAKRLRDVASFAALMRFAVLVPGFVLCLAVVAIARGYWRQAKVVAERDTERNRTLRLQATDQRVSAALEIAQTEDDVLDTIRNIFVAEHKGGNVEILLADSSRTHLRQVISTDPTKQLPGCAVPSPQECPAVRRGSAVSFDDPTGYSACPHLRSRGLSNCSATCIPLNLLGQTLGVMHAVVDDSIDSELRSENTRLLDRIATQLGDRLGIIRTLSQTKLQAATDPLTGLHNRRSLEHQFEKFGNVDLSFSVAFFDLDHFKQLNDTHGHEMGDRALRVFAKTLRDALRTNDLICRWGGEEFVVVLPGTNLEAAAMLAERVSEALVLTLTYGSVPHFNTSAGVAMSLPNETLLDVVMRADEALLEAKRNGRNRVVVSGEMRHRDLVGAATATTKSSRSAKRP
jgi:diguanylate cyclase (GGDEF)-like protein